MYVRSADYFGHNFSCRIFFFFLVGFFKYHLDCEDFGLERFDCMDNHLFSFTQLQKNIIKSYQPEKFH